jgi:hypothetical protein
MVTVNRGGITMTIPRNLAHHVPPVTVGHLDDEGMVKDDSATLRETVHCPKKFVDFQTAAMFTGLKDCKLK